MNIQYTEDLIRKVLYNAFYTTMMKYGYNSLDRTVDDRYYDSILSGIKMYSSTNDDRYLNKITSSNGARADLKRMIDNTDCIINDYLPKKGDVIKDILIYYDQYKKYSDEYNKSNEEKYDDLISEREELLKKLYIIDEKIRALNSNFENKSNGKSK